MAYKALYRKYRPKTFEEVIGQQHIIATLKNAIDNNKLAHAYLFCGPRGTGKTSTAKLLAKIINCQGTENKPCCQCSSCIDIQDGSHPDVVELDAASNNGVDEVRELIEKVKYAPMNGKYKVYIIDEVHMMTPAAFNALLKTLEEPPEYCIFILATTEPQKVLPTIISRCQRFDFKKIPAIEIKTQLENVCKKENISCDDDALALIAELAEGGMRDALSILDQCAAYSKDVITADSVSEVYGVASLSEKMNIFKSISEKKAKELIGKIADISSRGLDIQRLTIDLINIVKECVIYSYCNDETCLSVIKKENADEMLQMFRTSQMLTFIDYLVDAQTKYRDATNSLIYFEVCVLKMIDYREGKTIVTERPVETKAPIRQPKQNAPAASASQVKTITTKDEKALIQPSVNPNVFSASLSTDKIVMNDDEMYEILTKANKELKIKDATVIAGIKDESADTMQQNILLLIHTGIIFASSNDCILMIISSRENANFFNNKSSQEYIQALLNNNGINKVLYAITSEEKEYLVGLFKARSTKPVIEVKQKETNEIEDKTKKLEQFFGKDGFDIVGE